MFYVLRKPLIVTDEHEISKLWRKVQTRLSEIENQKNYFKFIK